MLSCTIHFPGFYKKEKKRKEKNTYMCVYVFSRFPGIYGSPNWISGIVNRERCIFEVESELV